ncbi:hypothetical protein DUI87_29562 [Hirundo rustica rustica]|uniref:Uncharacterized protein n=1 Tax=Hirundo rustica rustica TaxID=333673 RepID=A0A3M0IZG0_HIRRU|nr:hypothetical protein DUI87_29562 [Hirundo rustica rustica]
MTPEEIFSQPFTQLFGSTPPAFVGFKSLNANDIIQWLLLLVCLFCLAFRDKGSLTWITTLIPTPENKDTAPQPDPAPQPASEINHPDWVKEIHEMLREHISPVVASLAPAGGKPSSCPNKGESDGAAMEPTDVTTVQVPAESQGQSQPAAVVPVETKTSKVKSANLGNKDKKGGPSQPAGEPQIEIITESLSYESLRNLQKMYDGDVRLIQPGYFGSGTLWQLTLLEAEVSLTGKEWQKHPIVTGSEALCILGVDFLWNGYDKDSKGLRWAFGIAAVEAEGIKKLNTLPGLLENPSAVGLLKEEEQQVPVATSTVHCRQYRTN